MSKLINVINCFHITYLLLWSDVLYNFFVNRKSEIHSYRVTKLTSILLILVTKLIFFR